MFVLATVVTVSSEEDQRSFALQPYDKFVGLLTVIFLWHSDAYIGADLTEAQLMHRKKVCIEKLRATESFSICWKWEKNNKICTVGIRRVRYTRPLNSTEMWILDCDKMNILLCPRLFSIDFSFHVHVWHHKFSLHLVFLSYFWVF